jgi:hypothetical protein
MRSPVDKVLTLSLICSHCNGTVSLTFDGWSAKPDAPAPQWRCPSCGREHRLDAFGEISAVRKTTTGLPPKAGDAD